MPKTLVDIQTWKRAKKFNFFIKMANPLISITSRIYTDNCYAASKKLGKSFFLCYSYAIIKAINEIEEMRYRIERVDGEVRVYHYDDVLLVTPISVGDEGEFIETTIPYNSNFDEFYREAERIISSVSADSNPMVEGFEDSTFAVISALPFLDFTCITTSLSELGGISQVPLIGVGKMTKVEGVNGMPVAISVHHGLVDGFQLGKFYKIIQETLDSFSKYL